MPLQLTTAFNVGDLDTTTYAQLKIIAFTLDLVNKTVTIMCQYGNTVDGVWINGLLPDKYFVIKNKPAQLDSAGDPIPNTENLQFNIMMASMPNNNESVYNAAARKLYKWLKDNHNFSGTVV